MKLSRRKILQLALLSPFASLIDLNRLSFLNAPSSIIPETKNVKLTRRWSGSVCYSQLVNHGRDPVRIKSVVLFDLQLQLPGSTRLYGEGFQMLTQTGGTLGQPVDLGNYTDAKHYKLPTPDGAKALYGMMLMSPSPAKHHLLAFTSCRRFAGQFYLNHRL